MAQVPLRVLSSRPPIVPLSSVQQAAPDSGWVRILSEIYIFGVTTNLSGSHRDEKYDSHICFPEISSQFNFTI